MGRPPLVVRGVEHPHRNCTLLCQGRTSSSSDDDCWLMELPSRWLGALVSLPVRDTPPASPQAAMAVRGGRPCADAAAGTRAAQAPAPRAPTAAGERLSGQLARG